MNNNHLTIPDSFREKIFRIFRKEGETWLTNLPVLLEEFIEKWRLTGCLTEENLSVHYICYAHSPEYGEVVLKTAVPHLELFSGMDALKYFDGKYACKLHETDREKGIMLLERIIPGTRLKDESDFRKRIEAGIQLVKTLPVKIDELNNFPVWQKQMEKAFKRAGDENRAGREFISMLGIAEEVYKRIRSLNRPQMLLHGDLHHENILKDEADRWRVIDPQGRIGEQCLECGRFLLNEWEWFGGVEDTGHMARCVNVFAEALGESPRTIAACCFLDCSLSHCWSLEDGGEPEVIQKALKIMDGLLKLMK